MMKILIINPNTSEEMTRGIDTMAKTYARPDTEIETVCSREGPRSLETVYENELAGHFVLERVIEGNEKKVDAIVIACYADPSLRSAKEISEVPVFGIAESSMHLACILGHKFSIVTVIDRVRPNLELMIRQLGLESRCASIRATPLSVLDLQKDPSLTRKTLTEEARAAVRDDGAEVICLGCTGMAGHDKTMEKELGVPVLDGVVCAVKMAEGVFDYKLKHSKVNAFAKPAPKEWVGLGRFAVVD
jgi:allantoin racemase